MGSQPHDYQRSKGVGNASGLSAAMAEALAILEKYGVPPRLCGSLRECDDAIITARVLRTAEQASAARRGEGGEAPRLSKNPDSKNLDSGGHRASSSTSSFRSVSSSHVSSSGSTPVVNKSVEYGEDVSSVCSHDVSSEDSNHRVSSSGATSPVVEVELQGNSVPATTAQGVAWQMWQLEAALALASAAAAASLRATAAAEQTMSSSIYSSSSFSPHRSSSYFSSRLPVASTGSASSVEQEQQVIVEAGGNDTSSGVACEGKQEYAAAHSAKTSRPRPKRRRGSRVSP